MALIGALLWVAYWVTRDEGTGQPESPPTATTPAPASTGTPATTTAQGTPNQPKATREDAEPAASAGRGAAEPTGPTPPISAPAWDPDDPWAQPGEGLDLEGLARRKAFRNEVRDPEWADAREASLQARLPEPPEGAHLEALECRSHHCRVIIVFDDPAKLSQGVHYSRSLRGALTPHTAVERHDLPDGSQSISLYLPR